MHLHLFMICVHVFVKVEITRSEVAAQTIQFAESFSWTRTKWKNSSVCGSGVEPEKLWPSCNPLGAHQNDGRDENMFQFRWLPNPSLLEKINTQQKHWYTTGLVLDLFILRSSDDNEWQGGRMWLVQVWHRENSFPSSFQCSCASGRAKRLLSRVWPRHRLSTSFMLPKYHSPPHPQIHLFDSDRSRCTSDFAGADCPDYKLPAISMVVSRTGCGSSLRCQLCVMWPWSMVSVTDLFAPTIFWLKLGATERKMDWWDQRGRLKLGMSLFCCIGRGHLTLPCSLQFASQNDQFIGLFSLLCIIMYPFLSFSYWHR